MVIDIREYIGREKELTAEQVRKLEPGSVVCIHNFDRKGNHQFIDATVIRSGKKKVLSYLTYNGREVKPIRKESERLCYTEVPEWRV